LLGIQIDSSDEDENANDSIRVSREFDSNMIDESDLQSEKLFRPRISTWLESQILIIAKHFQSICDGEHQSESHFQQQRYHSLIQLKLMIMSHREMQNHLSTTSETCIIVSMQLIQKVMILPFIETSFPQNQSDLAIAFLLLIPITPFFELDCAFHPPG
jgi:hypothetical protein